MKIYYAVKFEGGWYWQRTGSSTPALFSSENKARATIKKYSYSSSNYEIVKFAEVQG